jgi:hypothetical protein
MDSNVEVTAFSADGNGRPVFFETIRIRSDRFIKLPEHIDYYVCSPYPAASDRKQREIIVASRRAVGGGNQCKYIIGFFFDSYFSKKRAFLETAVIVGNDKTGMLCQRSEVRKVSTFMRHLAENGVRGAIRRKGEAMEILFMSRDSPADSLLPAAVRREACEVGPALGDGTMVR